MCYCLNGCYRTSCLPARSLSISALIAQKITSNANCNWHGLAVQWHCDASYLPSLRFSSPSPDPSPIPCHSPVTAAMPLVTACCPLLVEAVECWDVPKFNLVMLRHRFLPPSIHQPSCLWTIMICVCLCVLSFVCMRCSHSSFIPEHIIAAVSPTCFFFYLFFFTSVSVWTNLRLWMCPVRVNLIDSVHHTESWITTAAEMNWNWPFQPWRAYRNI